MFWDPSNLQAVTKRYHDVVKQAHEMAGVRAATRPPWLKPSRCELTIVCGPAGAGKSTWIKAHAAPRDRIIDLDECAAELSGHDGHDWDRDRWLQGALRLRNVKLGELALARPSERAWFIVGAPTPIEREFWQTKLRPSRMIVMAIPLGLCVERAATRPVAEAAARWWSRFQARPGEEIIKL